jgi:5-methylthioadenosine/S-adenosylhomocysteine deaminase
VFEHEACLDGLTGSIQPGKRSDVITPLLHGANFNVATHVVFSCVGNDVDHVWVDGRLLVEGGHVLSC